MRVKIPWTQALRERDEGVSSDSDQKNDMPGSRELTPKRMCDSYHSQILPLAQDPWMLDNYLNASGHLRLGTIFMDLDALSGVVAYKHTGESVMTVTAAVDRITLKNRLKEICDLQLSGQVTFATGRSSMEISLQVAKAPVAGSTTREEDVLLTCAFTMVSLDPLTKKPVAVAPLKLESPEDRRLFDIGEKNYEVKRGNAKKTLRKTAPNDEESEIIHSMWMRQREFADPKTPQTKPPNVVYMSSTKLHAAQIMQPQYRNRHNFMIFGGFLLKQTFELAFCCAAAFSHSRPRFVSLDPSTFENPVPVGSVLYLTATVAFSEAAEPERASPSGAQGGTRVQVRVDSRVRTVEHEEEKPTGQFNYTFWVEREVGVMPQTYEEYMIWVDARRRARQVGVSLE